MSDRYQGLGLALLVSLGVVVGGATAGRANPVRPVVAQATADEAQQAINEGMRLFAKQDKESLRGAIDQFEKVLKLSRQSQNQDLQALALAGLARIHAKLGNPQKALEFYNQALPIFRAVGNRPMEAVTLNTIGSIYSNLGGKQKALEFYNQALPILRAVGNRSVEAATLTSIGLVYSSLGEKRKALEFYNQALPIFRAVGDRSMEAVTLNTIGSVYDTLGESQKALEFYNQALSILRAVGDRSVEAATLTNIGGVYSDLGEQQKALEFYNQALPVFRAVGGRSGEATTLTNIGKVYSDLGEKQKALEFYNQALPIRRSVGDRSGEATTLTNIGKVYSDLGEKQKALEFYNQALPISRTVGDRLGEATTLTNIGGIYSGLGEKQKALALYDQALPIFRAVGHRFGQATTLNNIGLVYSSLGEKQKALEFYNQALPILRAVGHRSGEATTLSNLGDVYSDLGEKQKALEFYNQSLPISRAMGNRSGEATTLNSIGVIYSDLGEKQKALEFHNQSLPIFRAVGSRSGEAGTLSNIGAVYFDLGKKQKALEFFNQSLPISRAIGDRFGEATTLNNIGAVYSDLGEKQKALKFYNQALPLLRAVGDRSMEANTLNNIGSVYFDLGKRQKALEFGNQALPIFRAVGDRSGEAWVLGHIARVNISLNELTQSLQNINAAIAIIETLRSELNNDALKTSYFKSVQSYYELKIDILMQLHRQQPNKGYDIAALETADQSRGRVLRELLIQSNAKLYTNIAPDLLKREQTLNQTIDAQEKQLIQRSEQRNSNTQELKDSISKLYADRDDLKNEIRAKSPAYANLQYPKPTKLAELQQQLDPDTVMLQYSLGDTESYLWVISNTGMKSYILPKQTDIEKTSTAFLSEVINQYPLDRSASLLTQQILTPAAEQIKGKRLVIIPDGILHKVPFAALTLPNLATYTPLLTQHEITHLPSASTIGILRSTVATKPRAKKTIALLADPVFNKSDTRLTGKTLQESQDFDTGDPLDKIAKKRIGRGMNFARLPGTATEANGILSLVPDERDRTTAFGFDANYNWVTSPTLSQYRYIHLATHGFFDGEKPAFSSIVLSGYDSQGRDRKSYLRLPELFNLNLSAELVVLSACQTGLGNEVPGEGSVGMTRGLMYAGALRVSTTLWSVNDNATAELMQDFYKNLWQSKKSHAASLRAAQLKLWNEGKAPYLWAAFTLQGEWRD